MQMMLEIPDDVYLAATSCAEREGRPLGDLVTDGLRKVIAVSPSTASKKGRRVSFPLVQCEPGVVLNIPDDIASRLEEMEDLERHEASLRR